MTQEAVGTVAAKYCFHTVRTKMSSKMFSIEQDKQRDLVSTIFRAHSS